MEITKELRAEAHRNLRSLRIWLPPVLVIAFVTISLALSYLGGVLNPAAHIDGVPIAVVNEDKGAETGGGNTVYAGDQLADGMISGLRDKHFNVLYKDLADAEEEMNRGRVYGMIVIPATFSSDLVAYATGVVTPGEPVQPTIQYFANERAGTTAATIATKAATAAVTAANEKVGVQLAEMVNSMYREVTGTDPTLSATTQVALAHPIRFDNEVYRPLPDGNGNGISAFYYALLLLIAGFTGSIILNTLVDSRLGYTPVEIGPRFIQEPTSAASRVAVMVLKWFIMGIVAVVSAGLYLVVCDQLGMPLEHPWLLWSFGALAIWAVAVAAVSIQSIFGGLGQLISLFLFIILGIPSAGATVPLEVMPKIYADLAQFEPLRQIYLGTRAILYLDGRLDAGLMSALLACGISTAAAIAIGLVVVGSYDRRGKLRGLWDRAV